MHSSSMLKISDPDKPETLRRNVVRDRELFLLWTNAAGRVALCALDRRALRSLSNLTLRSRY